MERKRFIATTAGIAASLAAAGAALAATPTPNPMWTRRGGGSDTNLARVHRHLERIIDELQHDQHDYCGHRARAVDLLVQARQEIEAGLKCDQTH